jgi:hypothetical protein
MPMFTKYTPDKQGLDGGGKCETKNRKGTGNVTGEINVYLSRTKSIVKSENVIGLDERAGGQLNKRQYNVDSTGVVDSFKKKIISRADQYIAATSNANTMNDGWNNQDREIFLKIINTADNDFSQWIATFSVPTSCSNLIGADQVLDAEENVDNSTGLLSLEDNHVVMTGGDISDGKTTSLSNDVIMKDVNAEDVPPSNPYLAWRARKIQLNNEKLRSLDLIDDDVLRKEVGHAWSLGSTACPPHHQDNNWCDFSTMTVSEIPVTGKISKDASSGRKAGKNDIRTSNKGEFGVLLLGESSLTF